MSHEILTMGRCNVKCPKVREQLRAEVAKRPWLVDEVFPQRKTAGPQLLPDPVSRDTSRRDEPERVVEPASIQESRIMQETSIVQKPIVFEKMIKQDNGKIDFVEEKELVVERITIEEDGIIENEIDRTIPAEQDETEYVIKPADVQEPKIVQEASIAEQIIVENEVDRMTTPTKFEPEPKANAEPQFLQDKLARRLEYREKEIDDDYDKFIDERLQSLPTVTIEQIPDEKEEKQEEIKTVRQEKIPIKDAEIDREEPAGPSVAEEHRVSEQDREITPSIVETVSRESICLPAPIASEDTCDDMCPLIDKQREHIMHKLKERQRIVDHYYLTKGFSYFEDVCTCSLACILYTLSRDQFMRSIFASLALFAVGLKLCSELDAWEMPSRVS